MDANSLSEQVPFDHTQLAGEQVTLSNGGQASVKTPAKGTSMHSNTYVTFHAVTAREVGHRHTPPESHFMQCLHRR